jgi:3',5'-cyclic AMP phosphodiesterase CpdA
MRIALISDTHLASIAGDFVTNYLAAQHWIDANRIDLVIHLGDITADGINAAEQLAFAHDLLTRLCTPLRLVPGNHDVGDNPVPGLESTEKRLDPACLALYRRTFGPDYWLLKPAGWNLIGLNSLLMGLGDTQEAAQLEWLDQTLASLSGPIGLLLHKPLFRDGPEENSLHHRYVPRPARDALLARFQGHELRFVASGHTHQLRYHRVGSVEHVWVPSTAFILPDSLQERIGAKVVGLMTLTLSPDRCQFEFHTPQGMAARDLRNYGVVFPRVSELLMLD